MAEAHPVGFRWVMKAKERGARIIHVDPRYSRTSQLAAPRVDDLAAAHRAVGTDRLGYLQARDAGAGLLGCGRERAGTQPPIQGAAHQRQSS